MRRSPSVLVIALLATQIFAQTDLESKIPPKAEAALKESGAPSVSLAVVSDGKIWAKAFGKANLAENRPATVSTRYAVGSVSRQFTAAAILLLEAQSKLSLDNAVGRYFPDLTQGKRDQYSRAALAHFWI